MHRARWLLAALVVALPAAARPSQAAPTYVFTDLGSLGGTDTYAYSISASGRIVGTSALPGTYSHAFVYDDGGMHDLGTLGGPRSAAYAINDSGGIVGQSDLLVGNLPHVFVYAGAHMTDLGIVPDGRPLAINSAGHIVGSFCLDAQCTTYSHAFLYDGTMHDLGTLTSCPYSYAYGINDQDEIVGGSCVPYASTYVQHAFIYHGGVMTDINDLAPPNLVGLVRIAYAVNNSGVVVGDNFIYAPGTPLVGPLNFGPPIAINNLGQVVGASGSGAFLYSGGAVTLLSTFPVGWTVQASPMGINDAGQITGTAYDADGHAHGFLLSSTGPPGGSPCATLDSCRDALAAALPGVDINGSQKSQRVARKLQKLDGVTDHALDRGAASASGQKRHRWYAKARAALTRLLKVARAASDRATLGVPLAPIEAAVAALLALLPA